MAKIDKLYALNDDFVFNNTVFSKVKYERIFCTKKVKILRNGKKEKLKLRVTNFRICFTSKCEVLNFKVNKLKGLEAKIGNFSTNVFLHTETEIVEFKISKSGYSKLYSALSKTQKNYGLPITLYRGNSSISYNLGDIDAISESIEESINECAEKIEKAGTNILKNPKKMYAAGKALKFGSEIANDPKKRAIAGKLGKGLIDHFLK